MDTKALKSKILDLAMRGALVENHAAEGEEDGAALLRRITHYRAEKQKADCLADCKKRGYDSAKTAAALKKLPSLAPVPIPQDEQPFEIPDNWTWCRLGDIGTWGAGSTPSRHNPLFYQNGNIPWIKTGELNDGIIEKCEEFITEAALKKCSLELCEIGDVMIAMYGATIGKVAIAGIKATTNQACCVCHPCSSIYNKFLFYFLMANKSNFIRLGYGGAQPNISTEKIKNFPIPLPPLSVQQRIVAKIEEAFAVIAQIEEGSRLVKENASALKARTLSLAMRGALVENHTAEGEEDGAALLRRITHYRAEKQKADCLADCQKRGYDSAKTAAALKKLPSLAPVPVSKAEQPFEIPDNWTWCRLGEVCDYGETRSKVNSKDVSSDTWELNLEDIEKGGKIIAYKTVKESNSIGEKTVFSKGDILYSKLRPYLLKILIAPNDGICTPEIVPFREFGGIAQKYIVYFLKSPSVDRNINSLHTYGVKMPRVSTDTMKNLSFPLPPLSVQKRIVAKIEEVFAVANMLEKA